MKKQALFTVLIIMFLVSMASAISTPSAESAVPTPALATAEEDGKAVFLKYKCDNCHSVSTAGIVPKVKTKAPDLVNVTVRHEKDGGKDFVHKYIRQEQGHVSCPKVDSAREGKLHTGGKFKGTQAEEDALVDWLDQQRAKE